MSKKVKIIALMFALIVVGAAGTYVAKAGEISFNVTVNQNVMNKDPLSRKEIKTNRNDNYYPNDYFKVEPTHFSSPGTIKLRSVYREDTSQSSPYHLLSSIYVKKPAQAYKYGCAVHVGHYYYLQTMYGTGSSKEINVKGLYSP